MMKSKKKSASYHIFHGRNLTNIETPKKHNIVSDGGKRGKERKEKHTESKRIQQICSFRFGFFLLFQLCVPFRFYASTKFMSINYEYVFISFSISFCPFYSHTYFIGPSFSSVAVLSSNEVKQFCFCCSKSNINFIENASRRMNERKSRRHNKIRFTKQASNLICFAEMLNDSK